MTPAAAAPARRVPTAAVLPDGRPAAAAWTLDPALRHLNHGSFGAVPRAAQEEQARWRAELEASPQTWFAALPGRLAAARAQVAPHLGVRVEDLAFVPNASGGASVVFASLPVRPGVEVVVTDHGYGAVTAGAERLARRAGGTVRRARVPLAASAEEACAAVVAEFTDRTGLVVVDHVTSPTARFLPVAEISTAAAQRGIPVLVDGAHVPALVADPLAGVSCDFWVGNLHKFACAPRGAAVLVARGPLVAELNPLIDSWGYGEPFPHRFDHQGTLDESSYLAAPAALEFVERTWGWAALRGHLSELAEFGAATVAAAFAERTGEDHRVDVGMPVGPQQLVRLPRPLGCGGAVEAGDLRDRVLTELGVATAVTSFDGTGYVRLSAHAYNTPGDYEDFAQRCVPVLCDWAGRAGGRGGAAGAARRS